jgi:hypothetical protein
MVAYVLSTLALILSVLSFAMTYRWNVRSARLARKPILSFRYDADVGWKIRNVGNGPAFKVVIAHKNLHDDDVWIEPTRVQDISQQDDLLVAWLGHANIAALCASYDDYLKAESRPGGRSYTTVCISDSNETAEGRKLPSWDEVTSQPQWLQQLRADAISSMVADQVKRVRPANRGGSYLQEEQWLARSPAEDVPADDDGR